MEFLEFSTFNKRIISCRGCSASYEFVVEFVVPNDIRIPVIFLFYWRTSEIGILILFDPAFFDDFLPAASSAFRRPTLIVLLSGPSAPFLVPSPLAIFLTDQTWAIGSNTNVALSSFSGTLTSAVLHSVFTVQDTFNCQDRIVFLFIFCPLSLICYVNTSAGILFKINN